MRAVQAILLLIAGAIVGAWFDTQPPTWLGVLALIVIGVVLWALEHAQERRSETKRAGLMRAASEAIKAGEKIQRSVPQEAEPNRWRQLRSETLGWARESYDSIKEHSASEAERFGEPDETMIDTNDNVDTGRIGAAQIQEFVKDKLARLNEIRGR